MKQHVFLLLGLLLGVFFHLRWFYLLFLLPIYLFFLSHIRKNQIRKEEELNDFRQINAYMSQTSQTFVRTKNILSALQETADTFPSGKMQTLLLEVIDILLLEGGDINDAERKALKHLETNYPCERLHTLHEFMLLAENLGGDCKKEFVLLEKMRIAWEKAVLKYHQTLLETRNVTTFLYGFMLIICIFVLHAFPIELDISDLGFIQFTNFVLTALFIIFYAILDKRICGQLFRASKKLTKEKEIELAFPKWLFDLMLLIQRESVESAILHSISTAPPVLCPELSKMSQALLEYPEEISVFTSFLSEYHLPQVDMNMRKLYALSIGAEDKEESINFMIESNMEHLMKAEEKSYEWKGGISNLFQFLPLLCVSFGMLLYCLAIIIVSLSQISALFQ